MSDQTNTPAQDENHLIAERRQKLAEWRATGKAYPNDFSRENTAGKLDEVYGEKTAEELEAMPVEVKVAGRIMLKRVMGKASFITIQDLSGRIQLYVTRDALGEEGYADFKRDLTDVVIDSLAPFQARLRELDANPDYTAAVLKEGAERARAKASTVLTRVKGRMGYVLPFS